MQKLKKAYNPKIVLIMIVLIVLMLMPFFHFYKPKAHVKMTQADTVINTYVPHMDILEKHGANQKWIVITSVNGMTPSIQQMATFSEYRVVVVMDETSPDVQHAEENIVFLTIEHQKNLGLNLYEHVPFSSYTRKNIGYLYAMQNGARLIYDTDDDNFLEFPPRERNSRMDELTTCADNDNKLALNPYAAFGKPAIWPRGFPLESIAHECMGRGSKRTSTTLPLKDASIWQGLSDIYPDTDAIFSMTHADEAENVIFPRRPPVFIPNTKFAPINSQNTLFFYESFWGLYLPYSVSFRVTDIWRGYFVQKLMRYTGSHVAFIGPTKEQYRNGTDYEDERQLYEQTTAFLRFLHEWEPQKSKRFFDVMMELAQDMVYEDFWGDGDVRALRAWITDLKRLGYEEPSVVKREDINTKEMSSLCTESFEGKKIEKSVENWWKETEKNSYETFDVPIGTRDFEEYLLSFPSLQTVEYTKWTVLRVLKEKGWSSMHWLGFLTQKLTHQDTEVKRIQKELNWDDDEQCVAVYVQGSDKKMKPTSNAFLYVDEVRRLKIEHPDITSIFLAYEKQEALTDFIQTCKYYIPPLRMMVDKTENQTQAVTIGLLSSCPYLVGNFSSLLTRAAAYRMVGSPEILQTMNAEDRFRSIDEDDALQAWTPQNMVLLDLS